MGANKRAHTLNVTLAFVVRPTSETFVVPVRMVSAVEDAGKLVELGQNYTNLAVNSAATWADFSQ